MDCSLKVMSGKYAGQLIKIPGTSFLIGRSEECQLRPHSDLISRQHCQITIEGDKVTAADKGSRNGTFVNGERIPGPVQLKHGDKLGVGQLIFEVLIPQSVKPQPAPASDTVTTAAAKVDTHTSHPAPKPKHPKVKDVADVAQRLSNKKNIDDEDISDWLNGDDMESLNDTSTIQLSQTQQLQLLAAAEDELGTSDDSKITDPKKKKEKIYGKLPPIPKPENEAKNSKEAAAEMLKRMMKNR
jgi:pSer/pThr/pTyr-binding forkhead associated (FHA) protein